MIKKERVIVECSSKATCAAGMKRGGARKSITLRGGLFRVDQSNAEKRKWVGRHHLFLAPLNGGSERAVTPALLGEKEVWMDCITGTLYSTLTGASYSSSRMRLDLSRLDHDRDKAIQVLLAASH